MPWGEIRRLGRMLDEGDAAERRSAIDQLLAIGGRRAMKRIERALGDAAWRVRLDAAEAIELGGDARSIPKLLPLLHDRHFEIIEERRVRYPVREASFAALREHSWRASTSEEEILVRTATGESIANHHQIVYFLGAGFAACYGLPLARDLAKYLYRFLWNLSIEFKIFVRSIFGVETAEEAIDGVALDRLLDEIERRVRDGNDSERAQALEVREIIDHWVRQEFAPQRYEVVRPKSAALQRFFRFLVTNDHHNFVLTTNWDTFLDGAFQTFLHEREEPKTKEEPKSIWESVFDSIPVADRPLLYVDYGLYPYLDHMKVATAYCPVHLYKINGSADWLWCEHCKIIYGEFLPWPLYNVRNIVIDSSEAETMADALRCAACRDRLVPKLVMPSPLRPQHLLSRLYQSEELKREIGIKPTDGIEPLSILWDMATTMGGATLWVFMGYSMPEYDADIINLVRMGLERSSSLKIHVVALEPNFTSTGDSWLWKRYAEVLGREFRYFHGGIEQ